jgi:hypothetical protein
LRLRGKVETEERKVTWHFIIAFLLGSIFAELTSDILSDVLFFKRAEQGAFTPIESVVYWYYIPATMYFLFLILAIVLSYSGFKAKYFAILLSVFAGIGFVWSLKVLGVSPIIVFLLIIPLVMLVFVLHNVIQVEIGRKKVRI